MPSISAPAESPSILAELGAFVLIGVGAMVGFIALSTLALQWPIGVPRWLVSAICYSMFIAPVYLLHRRFSFHAQTPHRQALPRYIAVQTTALLLAAVFSSLAYGVLSMPTPVASALVIMLTSGVNFMVLRVWAFARGQ